MKHEQLERRTISLPHAQAAYIDRLVKNGSFGSASEVVRAGLRLLKRQDAVLDQWLRDAVAPVYDRMINDPDRAIPGAKVLAELRHPDATPPRKRSRRASRL